MSLKVEIDLKRIYNYVSTFLSKFNIGHLLLLSLALHLFVIPFPSDGGMIFDEAHYVPAAVKTLNLQPANAEHMPLAKIVIAISIAIFGNYWFAWRFPIVLMGIASLYVFYRIAKRFMSERYALFATAMLSFDVIYFIHGSIFVLDMPAILFGLMGMELYFAKKYEWSALSFGTSFLMKELGLFFLAAISIYHIATHLKLQEFKSKLNLRKFAVFLVVLLLIGGGGLWVYDIIFKPTTGTTIYQSISAMVIVDQNGNPITTQTQIQNVTKANAITNPVEHVKFSWDYFSGLAPAIVTPESQFRPPWSWTMPIGDIFNSPHYLTVVVTAGGVSKTTIDWISQITPFVEYFFLPIVAIALFNIVIKKDENKLGVLLVGWITVSYVPWLLMGLFVQRMTFNYYILYTIPAFALGIPYFWSKFGLSENYRTIAMLLHLLFTIVFFFYFFPVMIVR